ERALKLDPAHVGNLVAYLCSDAAQEVSGQLFAVRGREVFLMSQPRPLARIVSEEGPWRPETLAAAVDGELRRHFLDLGTDLEAFNTEPFV
ncbi:MAG TPA: 3-hydroxyacyl-CoA dehydrogenase, partial [Alphaproteobacteria bacterium]|nr:3-hydroxyacyl-CoA dehydrogenase [Alphaproteobacteria bacterium]